MTIPAEALRPLLDACRKAGLDAPSPPETPEPPASCTGLYGADLGNWMLRGRLWREWRVFEMEAKAAARRAADPRELAMAALGRALIAEEREEP